MDGFVSVAADSAGLRVGSRRSGLSGVKAAVQKAEETTHRASVEQSQWSAGSQESSHDSPNKSSCSTTSGHYTIQECTRGHGVLVSRKVKLVPHW